MEYEVVIYETISHRVEVTADNKDDAYNKAYEIIGNGPDDEYDTESDGFTGQFYINELS